MDNILSSNILTKAYTPQFVKTTIVGVDRNGIKDSANGFSI